MEISRAGVRDNKSDVLSVNEFIEKYGNGLKSQSLYYAMDNDLIDWVSFGGRERYIVMTAKTKEYTPNENKKRIHSTLSLTGESNQ